MFRLTVIINVPRFELQSGDVVSRLCTLLLHPSRLCPALYRQQKRLSTCYEPTLPQEMRILSDTVWDYPKCVEAEPPLRAKQPEILHSPGLCRITVRIPSLDNYCPRCQILFSLCTAWTAMRWREVGLRSLASRSVELSAFPMQQLCDHSKMKHRCQTVQSLGRCNPWILASAVSFPDTKLVRNVCTWTESIAYEFPSNGALAM